MKSKLSDNLRRVKDRIANACGRVDRSPDEVTLVAVTKYVGIDVIRQLVESGCGDLGEARVQELTQRAAMTEEMGQRSPGHALGSAKGQAPPNWHMVGHLQRNKVKPLLQWVSMVHSVDSLRLAEEIDSQAAKLDKTVDILLQVNAAGEKQKFGVAVGAVPHLAEQLVSLENLRVCGLMAMAPLAGEADQVEWTFARTREIFEDMLKDRALQPHFRHLSMGMSQDFEQAIERGSTMVRVGSALFEGIELEKPDNPD